MKNYMVIRRDSPTFDSDIISSFKETGQCLISEPFPHYITIMNHIRSRLDGVFENKYSIKADEPWHNETTERIFNPHLFPMNPKLLDSVFPEDLHKLCGVVYKASRQLGMMVLRSIDLEFGTNLIECHTPTETVKDASHMVLIKYLEKPSIADSRMKHHCDIGTITILHVFDETEDLEIRTDKESSNWTTASFAPAVVINVGETLQAWLNNKISAVPHRVVNKHNKRRYTMPIFMAPGGGAPLPEHVLEHRDYQKRIEQDVHEDPNVGEFIKSLSSEQLQQLYVVISSIPQEDPDDIYIPVSLNIAKKYHYLQKLFEKEMIK